MHIQAILLCIFYSWNHHFDYGGALATWLVESTHQFQLVAGILDFIHWMIAKFGTKSLFIDESILSPSRRVSQAAFKKTIKGLSSSSSSSLAKCILSLACEIKGFISSTWKM